MSRNYEVVVRATAPKGADEETKELISEVLSVEISAAIETDVGVDGPIGNEWIETFHVTLYGGEKPADFAKRFAEAAFAGVEFEFPLVIQTVSLDDLPYDDHYFGGAKAAEEDEA